MQNKKQDSHSPGNETCVLCDGVAGERGGLGVDQGWEYHERSLYAPKDCNTTCTDGRCYHSTQVSLHHLHRWLVRPCYISSNPPTTVQFSLLMHFFLRFTG